MICSPSNCCRDSSSGRSASTARPVEMTPRPLAFTPRRRDAIERINQGVCVKERNSPMAISPLAGKPASKAILIDLARLEREYRERQPDLGDPGQLVSFGTSGHRGSSLRGTFTE